jgi:hypothetical protein
MPHEQQNPTIRPYWKEAHALRAAYALENPNIYEVTREFLEAAGGLAVAPWCGSTACEDRVKKADIERRSLGLFPSLAVASLPTVLQSRGA